MSVQISPYQVQQLSIFKSLTENETSALLSTLERVKLNALQSLFQENDIAKGCFILIAGHIEVVKKIDGQEQVLATLKAGDLVGHIALIDKKPRSATCRASESGALLLHLSVEYFEKLFYSQSNFAYKILDQIVLDLSQKLRGATVKIAEAQNQQQEMQKKNSALDAAKFMAGFSGNLED
jgi:CRP/FNR family cyclic AMP-dependent transcriptional regulator